MTTPCVCTDRYVILGGHRDAWVFGAIDPMSGAAVVHENVRSAGMLLSKGESIMMDTVSGPHPEMAHFGLTNAKVFVCNG